MITSIMVLGLGKRLQEFRKSLALSQSKFGLEIGLTKQSVANCENGQRGLSIETLVRLRELGADLNWLVAGKP